MDKGQRIRSKRTELGLTQSELAEKVDSTKQNIYKYERGIITNIPSDKIELLADALGVSAAYIMGWVDESDKETTFDNILQIETKRFPLLGDIACGEPIFADEGHESYIEAGADIRADFCLRCKGDSMINARILDGDIVFIRKQSIVDNGDIAAIVIDDEATLKRVFYNRKEQKLILQAENPRFAPLVYVNEELQQIRILGKAVSFQSAVR